MGVTSNWWAVGHELDLLWLQQHSFMEIDHLIFFMVFSPFSWFKKGICQFLAKERAQSIDKPFRRLSLLRKSVAEHDLNNVD